MTAEDRINEGVRPTSHRHANMSRRLFDALASSRPDICSLRKQIRPARRWKRLAPALPIEKGAEGKAEEETNSASASRSDQAV